MHAADVWELVTQGLPEAPADSTDLSSHLSSELEEQENLMTPPSWCVLNTPIATTPNSHEDPFQGDKEHAAAGACEDADPSADECDPHPYPGCDFAASLAAHLYW